MHTREKILQAARQYLVDHGQAGFTVRAVAAEADVNPGLVHHYFGSKDNLILELLEVESKRILKNAVQLKEELGLEGIKEAIKSGFFGSLVVGQLFVETIILSDKSDAIKEKLQEIIRSRRDYFTDLFGISDPQDKVMVHSMIFGLQLLRKVDAGIDIEKSVNHFFTRFILENQTSSLNDGKTEN